MPVLILRHTLAGRKRGGDLEQLLDFEATMACIKRRVGGVKEMLAQGARAGSWQTYIDRAS
jgi:hypothetical protein